MREAISSKTYSPQFLIIYENESYVRYRHFLALSHRIDIEYFMKILRNFQDFFKEICLGLFS
jgi:hypothetical protein